ncbi:MAG: hypothetical protein NT031_06175, partial [Planctomycetota bacterium]|nr:hypothetical protein [Planctomycetota bacterium]
YNAQGRIATETDAVGRVTAYGYDAGGEHLVSVTNAQGTATFTYVTGQGAAREHAVASATGPDGVTTTFTYDALGRLTQRTVGAGPQSVTMSFSYDTAGKVTATDSAGHATTTFYIAQGAIARTIDPPGQVASVTYDTLGRFVSATEPGGVRMGTSLDGAGLLGGIVDASRATTKIAIGGDIRRLQNVTDPGGDVTSLRYDSKGNLLETLYPDGSAIQYEYDSAGRVIATTDANGARTSFTYNPAGLITLRTQPDGSTVAYTYDAHRNLVSATDPGGTTALTYDAADRLTSIAYPNGKTITNTYDSAGRRATVADQTGFTVRYSYDALGRLEAVRDTADSLLVAYDYNSLGELASETRGNGSTTDYTYDAAGRVANITHRDAGSIVTGVFDYTYDAQDRIQTVTDATGTTTYTYDLTGQLVGVALPGGRTIAYVYDAEGNRVTVADSVNGTDNYTTNNADQYTAAGAETLTYDRAGRVVTSTAGGVTPAYSYDPAGRLAGITSPGSVIAFDYDALGNRIGKTENGVRIDFANDPAGLGSVFGEYSGTDTRAHYAIGLGIAARADSTGAEAYYHYDARGNTVLLSGAGGTSIASYSYLPFGVIAAQTGSVSQPFTFSGAFGVQDEAGSLYSMKARTYDAGLGRFTSRDPIGLGGGDANLYRFVSNDPVNLSDPSGLAPTAYGATVSAGSFAPYPTSYFGRGVIRVTAEGVPVVGDILSPITLDFAEANAYRVGTSAAPGVNLPAIWEGPAAAQLVESGAPALLNTATPGALSKGAQVLNFLKPVAKVLAPVAKLLTKIVPPPVQAALAALDVARIEKAAFDYYKDAGTYGEFDPDEKHFSPDYYNKNGDNWLLNQLIRDGIAGGKSKPEATLAAIVFLKKLNNDFIRDQQTKAGGAAGAAAKTTAATIEVIRPNDPNNIVGPSGAGADPVPDVIAPGQTRFDGFVGASGSLPYKIEFENKASASAPAQVVHITHTLDADVDLSTFAFTSFGFAVPAGANGTEFHTILDATATLGVKVKIDATLDAQTGALDVTYTSLDPATNDVPLDPFAGFLPPDDGTGRGDGFLTYSVQPKPGLADGAAFTAIASIVFDTEAAIATPTVTNTLDLIAPTSTVTALPATTSRLTFPVRWTGADNAGGSGLAGITLSYTDNGGPLLTATAVDAAGGFRFTGEVGHTYAFFSAATDNVGNTEALAVAPDATIQIVAPTLLSNKDPNGKLHVFTDADGDTYTVAVSGGGTLNVVLDDPDSDGKGPIDQLFLTTSTGKTKVSVAVKRAQAGDGIVTIGDLTVTGDLGAFTAKASDLTVDGVIASGFIGSVSVRDMIPADVFAGVPGIAGAGTAITKTKFSLIARTIGDGVIHVGNPAAAIKAARIGDAHIVAPSLGLLSTSGGAMNADLTVAGGVGPITVKGGGLAGDLAARTFGPVSVTGGNLSGTITSTTPAGPLGKAAALAKVSIVGGDFTGDVNVFGSLGAFSVKSDKSLAGGSITGATITAAKIASLLAAKNVGQSLILAGASLGADHALGGLGENADTFAAGTIGAV